MFEDYEAQPNHALCAFVAPKLSEHTHHIPEPPLMHPPLPLP